MSTDVMPDRVNDNREAPGAVDRAFDARYLSGEQAEELRAPWRNRAACKGQGALMDDPATEWEAKNLCSRCRVIQQCTNWVIPLGFSADPGGIVAGRTEAERSSERMSYKARTRNAGQAAQVTR